MHSDAELSTGIPFHSLACGPHHASVFLSYKLQLHSSSHASVGQEMHNTWRLLEPGYRLQLEILMPMPIN